MVKAASGRYALMGGAIVMGYNAIIDYMRHHEEADPRPMYVDHAVATTLTASVASAFYATRPLTVFYTGLFSFILVSPFSWWFMKNGVDGGSLRAPNVFYQNDCTEEEIERYRHQDMIEDAAARMRLEHAYGYHKKGD